MCFLFLFYTRNGRDIKRESAGDSSFRNGRKLRTKCAFAIISELKWGLFVVFLRRGAVGL